MAPKSAGEQEIARYVQVFVSGTLLLLFVCLALTGAWFTTTFVAREKARSEAFRKQIVAGFEHEYKALSEEAWTANYESIGMRIERLVSGFGSGKAMVVLRRPDGGCLYVHGGFGADPACADESAADAASYGSIARPALAFDTELAHYVMRLRLEIGSVPVANLRVELEDPNDLLLGQGVLPFVLGALSAPLAASLALWALWFGIARRRLARPYLARLGALKSSAAQVQVARQVAHDIRSPLLVLEKLLDAQDADAGTDRRLLELALGRIRRIAADLSARARDDEAGRAPGNGRLTHFATLVAEICAEKQFELRGRAELRLQWATAALKASAYVRTGADDLKRALSNLINNAAEASHPGADIDLVLSAHGDGLRVDIRDTGRGMPPEILAVLGEREVTSDKPNGTGLGFLHAKQVVQAAGGRVQVASEPGVGTTVTLLLPIAAPPECVIDHLRIQTHAGQPVTAVVVDDDQAFAEALGRRLEACPAIGQVVRLQSGDRVAAGDYAYFVDYEIGSENGLALIERLGLRNAILVTSHADDPGVLERCRALGVRMLPKAAALDVPVVSVLADERPEPKVDELVLIDDDPWIREIWQSEAAQRGLRLHAFGGATEFFSSAAFAAPRAIPIFVDVELGDGPSGIGVAAQLIAAGFERVFLATNYLASEIEPPPGLAGVVGKTMPAFAGAR